MIISIIKENLNMYSVKDLKTKSKSLGIRGYSTNNKQEILNNILYYFSVRIIQRRFRKYKAMNSLCPISLEVVSYPCWSKKTNKGRIYYNLEFLANYLITRGDFRDPSTREIYTNDELVSIDNLVKKTKLNISKSVVKAKNNPKFYKHIKDNEEQIDILTDRLRYIFWEIRDNIEGIYMGYEDINEITLNIDRNYLPMARYYLNILNKKCKRSKSLSLDSIKNIISEIKHDCQVTKHIKNTILDWIEKESQ